MLHLFLGKLTFSKKKTPNKNIPIVVGGAHAATFPDLVLKDTNVDVVSHYEGEKTFLDLIFEQVKGLNAKWNSNIPLLLMNSFYTEKETTEFIHNCDLSITSFKQNMFPRLHAETLLPLDPEEWGELSWYPPGHVDFYSCLEQQGILRDLMWIIWEQ